MKTIASLVLCSVLCANAQTQKRDELPLTRATPTQESQKLAVKQIDNEIAQLKDAIEGMKNANQSGDRASFRLYRAQARDAIVALDKLAASEMSSETKNAATGPKTSPTPTPTPSATMSPEPSASPEMEQTPTPTPTASPTASPTVTPSPTPKNAK